MPLINFDATQHKPITGFDALPPGWYQAMVTDSELKTSKSNPQNDYLKLTYIITGPQFANRKVFQNLNINHPKPEVRGYAEADLSAISRSVGVMNVQDSNQLHNIPLEIKLRIRTDETYGDQNDIVGYRAIDGSFTTEPGKGAMPASNQATQAPAPQAPAATQQPGPGPSPWSR